MKYSELHYGGIEAQPVLSRQNALRSEKSAVMVPTNSRIIAMIDTSRDIV